jgi:predicted double-glycine peptidase
MRMFRRLTLLVVLVLGGFLGWKARDFFGPPAPPAAFQAAALKTPAAAENRGSGLTLLDGVPDVRQSTSFSCGAAALQAVLHYYGVEEREDRLMKELQTSSEEGTHPGDILRVAKAKGLRAALREGLAFDDLQAALDRGIPVIASIQAWKDEDGSAKSWADRWEDGHYVIVLGLDAASVYVEDPSLLGCRGIIPRGEFLERWHDYEGPPPYGPGRRAYVRMGLFIEGRPAHPARPYCRVD